MFDANQGQNRSRGRPLRSPSLMTLMPLSSTPRGGVGASIATIANSVQSAVSPGSNADGCGNDPALALIKREKWLLWRPLLPLDQGEGALQSAGVSAVDP